MKNIPYHYCFCGYRYVSSLCLWHRLTEVEDCEIRMEYWDVTIDDEGPIFQFAFPKNETEKIQKILQFDADFDIWIDGEKYSREDALALLNKK